MLQRCAAAHTAVLLSLVLCACAQDDASPAVTDSEPHGNAARDAGGRDQAADASGGTRKPTRDAGARSERDAAAMQDAARAIEPIDDDTSDDALSSPDTSDASAGEQPARGDAGVASACSDSCPKQGGVDWLCHLRFMYGTNYAWHHFGSDFGGNAKWNQQGVSKNADVERELGEMAAQGVNVLRWWIFPDFRGDGIRFDAQDKPLGLGGTAVADLTRALELAEQHDLYLMLTLFSFDNFRPTKEMDGLRARSIRPLVLDAAARKGLMDTVVRPIAQTVAKSPHHQRVIAWDVINEPEWAITGASKYGGDPTFDANPELLAISHDQMETFLRDVIVVLREESEALVSVGSAAVKWRFAWSKLDVDFHQFHIYDWVNQYFPYSRSPSEYGVNDKPVVMGEFPSQGLMGVSYDKLVESWYSNGYGGSLSWAYSDPMFGGNLSALSQVAKKHACETRY
ncbi:MAG: hypothetical protein RLZZ450_5517 [Pseudomonadota bacterium]